MKNYIILVDCDLEKLEDKVNEKILDWYVPLGWVSTRASWFVIHWWWGTDWQTMSQAMVLPSVSKWT